MMVGNIGNKSGDIYNLVCITCGIDHRLVQVAHRNRHGQVVGYIFLCQRCSKEVMGEYRCIIEEVNDGHTE